MASQKIGLCIVIVGFTGTGKSFLAKQIMSRKNISNRPKLIFDINSEWAGNGTCISDIEEMIKQSEQAKNSCLVFDEATIFFRHGKQTERILKILVQKRHNENVIIFNFHSLRAVPLFILDFVNILYLKHTNDNFSLIEKKFSDFPEIWEGFTEVLNNKEDKFFTFPVVLNK